MKPITIIRKAVLLLLFSLIIPTSAGVYISIKEVTDPMTIYIINGSAMLAGCLLLLFIIQKSRFHLKEIGFRKGSLGMWVIPILFIEAIPFIAGLNTYLSLSSFTALCFFMVCVGIFEEGIFRGILFQYLKRINLSTAIWGSAVLFSLGHAANLLSGKSLTLTVAQIIFAFLFGFVAAEIVALTHSLQWVIIWHAVHNIVDQMTNGQTPMAMQMLLLSVQCVILLVLALMLWRRIKNRMLHTEK
ncbi:MULTISPECIES: CPBP family intramembrane glutamic endopeptidase [Bacillus]|uniref:CPBP family intramembrane glutamic endopeptidase n=1 Tax=Bacillus TaxID=1386 RepID=UPI000D043710|nr:MULTISPECIES: CPBP family intramembrane glutamic endopeptidase [Bacillus]MBU5257905.1 CPBP family intramembrane metalloprotease [Bacillus pumilus]MCK6164875.1 CPBP family intramembrane metalloprotease [Bacillus pumilus]MCK6185574.1 CPBP family intramembrane metalloprotease [Bacillus pumilus]PRS47635.1 CPBP family intramembrane metalloprotease [Bacillus sp. LNXM10]